MAQQIRKNEFAGKGAFVQFIGIVFLIGGFFLGLRGLIIGGLLGIGCLIAGSSMSKKLVCSNCGNRVEKLSRVCPTCRENFVADRTPRGFVN